MSLSINPQTPSHQYYSDIQNFSSTSLQKTLSSLSQAKQGTKHQEWEISQKKSREIQEGERKRKLRRLSRHRKTTIKNLHTEIYKFQLECKEFDIEKTNIQRLGIAQPQIHNISNINLSQEEIESLCLGVKFIPTPKIKENTIDTACKDFEKTVRWKYIFKDEDSEIPEYWIPSDKIPQKVIPEIETALLKLRHEIVVNSNNTKRNISTTHIKNLNKLLDNPNIIIITADKNLGYTIASINWYKTTCLEHLESNAYTECTTEFLKDDNGRASIDKIKTNLHTLINLHQHILHSSEIKWILQPQEYKPMKFYILAKIHKNPIKGRPIVPSMTWITHHLSQWIANQLNPLIPNLQWVLKDSNELLRTFHTINSNKNLKKSSILSYILSADVEALYPNMNIETGLILTKNLLTELQWETQDKINFLVDAMSFVLTQGYMTFEDRIFQQRDGAAMGSPMIPPYANIYMYMLERNTVYKYYQSGILKLYRRFIDDIFIIVQCIDNEKILQLKNDFNNIHPQIRLSWTEQSQKCNFLDLTVWLSFKNHIHTNVYQKPLNIYAYLPYHSYHTNNQKSGFIKAEALRYLRISEKDFDTIIELFKIRLQRRGYPLNFITQAIKDILWEDRLKHLFKSTKKIKNLPFLYKILYSPAHTHKQLRNALNSFTSRMKASSKTPDNLKQKITICYKLPRKLHHLILKNRKTKGF